MPKATVNTKSGATITIEGTQDEVADLLARFSNKESDSGSAAKGRGVHRPQNGGSRPTPASLLTELTNDGFFNTPKELGSVRIALEEKGHFYPVTTLSPLMLRLVRKKELRRIKDKKHWTYVR